jgi:hypothetical protein
VVRSAGPVHRPLLDLLGGLRSAAFVVAPLLLLHALGYTLVAVVVSLGALNLSMVEAAPPARTRMRVLVLSALTNATAFAGGTIVANGGWFAVVAVAVAVWAGLLLALDPELKNTGLITAVMFVVGVGLPGGGVANAEVRFPLLLVGGGFALAGILLQRFVIDPRRSPAPSWRTPVSAPVAPSQYAIIENSAAVAVTAALGLALALALGLERDFWVMLTVLVALRLDFSDTISYAWMRVVGTIGGAILASAVALATDNATVLALVLTAACVATFATRNVNYTIYAIALTTYVILLLNLLYSGGPELAATRVLDTLIGGSLACATGALLFLLHRSRRRAAAARPSGSGPPPTESVIPTP